MWYELVFGMMVCGFTYCRIWFSIPDDVVWKTMWKIFGCVTLPTVRTVLLNIVQFQKWVGKMTF